MNNRNKVNKPSNIIEQNVIQDEYHGIHIVIFYEGQMQSSVDAKTIKDSRSVGTVGVFNAMVNDQKLKFRDKGDGIFEDHLYKCDWNILGQCINGESPVKRLASIHHSQHFAFAVFAFYPDAQVH